MDVSLVLMMLVVVGFLLITIAILIARAIRKKRREYLEKGIPVSKKRMKEELESSISTTKTLLKILEDRGVNIKKAEMLLHQAEISMEGRLYSRVEDLLKEAKEEALRANKEHQEGTDILNAPPSTEKEENPKEAFQKFPPYYLQAKFEMGRAGDAIEKAGIEGRDIAQASEILRVAKVHFESENYEKAFSMAIKARKSAEGEVVEYIRLDEVVEEKEENGEETARGDSAIRTLPSDSIDMDVKEGLESIEPARELPLGNEICLKCGATVRKGDRFCRKCGCALLRCPDCGTMVLEDDVFCGKCGYKLVEEVFVCPECGTEIPGDAIICPNCGARFE